MIADVADSFGTVLRRYRLRSGLSQESLSARAGLSLDAIRALERGRRGAPRPSTVSALSAALGLTPAERAALVEAARRPSAHPVSDRPVQADPRGAMPTTYLRQMPTALIGRERDEAAVVHLLSDAALVTLTGPGGVGKTHLAISVGASLQHQYRHGVVFVDLSALRDPSLVAQTIAAALALRADGPTEAQQLLREHLRDRKMLLILDNFEQVAAAASLVADLVAHSPQVACLVTSRAVLHLRAERVYQVPPLEAPPPEAEAMEEMAGYAAIRLFLARARSVDPYFRPDRDTLATIAQICRHLDGLPLAIELVAAHVAMLSPAALLTRMEKRLNLLTGGARDLPDRQRTMRAAIDWSFELLAAPEQQLACRLAVFAGGANLNAIEAVGNYDGALDVWEAMRSLLSQSLVRALDSQAVQGEPRFGMLETIRDYCLERLASSGESAAVRHAHARYYLQFAEASAAERHGPTLIAWLDRLEQEHDNLRAVLTWAVGTDTVAQRADQALVGLRMSAALGEFWHIRGHVTEGRVWLERVLAGRQDDGASDAKEALDRALIAAAWLAQAQEDYGSAAAHFAASMKLRRADGRPDAESSDLLINAALVAVTMGNYARAAELLHEVLATHRAQDNRETISNAGLGLSLFRSAMVARERGGFAEAVALYDECLALHHAVGDREGIAIALLGLGDIARDLGDVAAVRRYSRDSLAIFQDLKQQWGMGFCFNNLAQAALTDGNLAAGLELAEESVAIFRAIGSKQGQAEVLTTRARLLRAQGHVATARSVVQEVLGLARQSGPRWFVAAAIEEAAALAVGDGHAARALRFLGAAEALRAKMDAPLPPSWRAAADATLTAACAAAGSAWERSRAEGRASPVDAIVEEVVASLAAATPVRH